MKKFIIPIILALAFTFGFGALTQNSGAVKAGAAGAEDLVTTEEAAEFEYETTNVSINVTYNIDININVNINKTPSHDSPTTLPKHDEAGETEQQPLILRGTAPGEYRTHRKGRPHCHRRKPLTEEEIIYLIERYVAEMNSPEAETEYYSMVDRFNAQRATPDDGNNHPVPKMFTL